jgi:hypothetical protein
VRAFDPNMNQWTTPDAYSGDVHDPMSQHPYMWNSNNPVQYSDPSGYVVDLNLIQDVAPDLGQKVTNAVVSAVGTAVKGFKDFSDGLRSVIENDLPDPAALARELSEIPPRALVGPGPVNAFRHLRGPKLQRSPGNVAYIVGEKRFPGEEAKCAADRPRSTEVEGW